MELNAKGNTTADIEIIPVDDPGMLREFIFLPSKLHSNYKNFVPPLYRDEFVFHDPAKNRHLRESEVIRLIARSNGVAVGRIMGIIYPPWNRKHRLEWARIFQFDCIDNVEVARALTSQIERWALSHGMKEIIGPFGFSDKDPQGLQVEGFDFQPVILSVSHQPYLYKLLEECGYMKYKDCVSYRMDIIQPLPGIYHEIGSRIRSSNKFQLLEFKKRSQLKPYILPVLRLTNETYAEIFGFMPMEDDEMIALAEQYLSFLDPELVKVVVSENNELVAYVVAMANISEGIKKARGKLFPFGFLHILWDLKKSKQLDLLLGAVKPVHRGLGINVLMGTALLHSARKKGMKVMDSHLVLEENRQMRAELERIGALISKRFRIFRKNLT